MASKTIIELPGIVSYQEHNGVLVGITNGFKILELAVLLPRLEELIPVQILSKGTPGPKKGSKRKARETAPVPPAPIQAIPNGMDPAPTAAE